MIEQSPLTKEKKKKPKPETPAAAAPEIDIAEPTPEETKAVAKVIDQQIANPGDLFDNLQRRQIELIKRTVARGADDDELRMFLNVCKGAQLNPFLRQVHFIKRKNNATGREEGTIQIGIDGFRAIAEGSGQYAGNDDAIFKDEFEETFGNEKNQIKKKVPGSATVTVWKLLGGERRAFTATARWGEYNPGTFMWRKMPYNQLAKCAEALALRKAFPKQLSGLYVNEEMEQANAPDEGEQRFAKAAGIISRTSDIEGLKAFKIMLAESDKYDDEQKTKLTALLEQRIMTLTNQNNASPTTPPVVVAD